MFLYTVIQESENEDEDDEAGLIDPQNDAKFDEVMDSTKNIESQLKELWAKWVLPDAKIVAICRITKQGLCFGLPRIVSHMCI